METKFDTQQLLQNDEDFSSHGPEPYSTKKPFFKKGVSTISKQIFFFIRLGLLVLVLLVSCQAKATPTLTELTGPGIGVGISDDVCPAVAVKVGQQISWTNQGRQEHIVRAKSVEGESRFESGSLHPGDSYAGTLAEPDTYQYDCSANGSLTGTIIVEP
jgi:hypothetical protein